MDLSAGARNFTPATTPCRPSPNFPRPASIPSARLNQRIKPRPENLRPVGACTSVGSPQRTDPASKKFRRRPNLLPLSALVKIFLKWSWRRDLNPRPSDYKSDALPAELRQPKQPCVVPPVSPTAERAAVPAQSAPQS